MTNCWQLQSIDRSRKSISCSLRPYSSLQSSFMVFISMKPLFFWSYVLNCCFKSFSVKTGFVSESYLLCEVRSTLDDFDLFLFSYFSRNFFLLCVLIKETIIKNCSKLTQFHFGSFKSILVSCKISINYFQFISSKSGLRISFNNFFSTSFSSF